MKRKSTKLAAILMALVAGSTMMLTSCNSDKTAESTSGGMSASALGGESFAAEPQGDPYEVVMTYLYWGTLPTDFQMVEDAFNEGLQEHVNAKVIWVPLSFSEIGTQPSLMISSGEKLDLMLCFSQTNFLDAVNKNMVIELDDLYNQYGSNITEDMGTAMAGGYVDGKLYGIPSTRVRADSRGLFFATEYLDKYNLDVHDGMTYEELDEVFGAIKEGEGDAFSPLVLSGSGLTTFEYFKQVDYLGADPACGGMLEYDGSNKIINVFASDEYMEHCKWMHKWYEAGYINGDAITTTDSTQSFVQNGVGASYVLQTYWDMEANQELGLAMDMTMCNLTGTYAMTSIYQGQTWALPITCEDPETTMKVLDVLYDDETLINMIYWGIEDVHYVKDPEHEGYINYPEGVTNATSTYGNPLGLYGAVDKMYQMAGIENYFEKMDEYNASITEDMKSPYLGYVFNTKNVKTDFAAVNDVLTQYRASLESGSVDPETVIPEFISALEAAGINTIIEQNQADLDKWIAEQG